MEESPVSQSQDEEGEDRISALPDHLLLQILELLDLRAAVRAGALSARWRHLPHQLSRLRINVAYFHSSAAAAGRGMLRQIMRAYTGATQRLLAVFPPPACKHNNCTRSRAVKSLHLAFYLSAPHLCSIGRAVEDAVRGGGTERLELTISPHVPRPSRAQVAEFGRQFMSFSRAFPVAFKWLTRLALTNLAFGNSDVADLINACDKLEILYLSTCELIEYSAALKIDAPRSGLRVLELLGFGCTRIELVSVPKLRHLRCHAGLVENPPVSLGHVPQLREVRFAFLALAEQTPFALSELLSRSSATNLSILRLNFSSKMIWIRPEHPKQLTTIFWNLTDVYLYNIFAECDLNWTMFILEGAPSLQKFHLSRHSCANESENGAEKINMVWEPSKNLKHLNLKLLVMEGFEEENRVINYVRFVMERATCLKRINLSDKHQCDECNAVKLECPRSPMDEASRHRIRERLAYGFSSPAEIIFN